MLKTSALIEHISEHPEYTNIVIMDKITPLGQEFERTPEHAIEYLSNVRQPNDENILWRINGSLEKNTLLAYEGY